MITVERTRYKDGATLETESYSEHFSVGDTVEYRDVNLSLGGYRGKIVAENGGNICTVEWTSPLTLKTAEWVPNLRRIDD